MTTIIQSHGYEMDHLQPEDKMEMATSPYPGAGDIDFDTDTANDPSVDNMLDDVDHPNDNVDLMQADTEAIFQDDDMLDDDFIEENDGLNVVDLNMDAYDGDENQDQQEEILIEEDARSAIMQDEALDASDLKTEIPVDQNQDDLSHFTTSIQKDEGNDTYELGNTNNHTNESDAAPVAADTGYQLDNGQLSTDPNKVDEPHHAYSVDDENLDLEENVQILEHEHEAEETINAKIQEEKADISQEKVKDQFAEQDQKRSSIANEFARDPAYPSNGEQADAGERSNNSTNQENATSTTNQITSKESASSLHPVMVTYLGQEMSLFPPAENDSTSTFFLADLSLAYKPFDSLLKACRDILGESLEHDDELVLDIPSLGLHISEDSRYSSQIALSEVLDVYMVLSRNDQVANPEPLQCHLSSRVCLSSQYAYLSSAACEGKTFSEIAADYVDSPEAEIEVYEETNEKSEEEVAEPDDEDGLVELEENNQDSSMHEPSTSIGANSAIQIHEEIDHTPNEPGVDEVAVVSHDTVAAQLSETNVPGDGIYSEHGSPSRQISQIHDFAEDKKEEIQPENVTELQGESQTPSSHTIEAEQDDAEQEFGDEFAETTNDKISDVKDSEIVNRPDADSADQDDIQYSDDEFFPEEDNFNADFHTAAISDKAEAEEDLFAAQPNDVTEPDLFEELDADDAPDDHDKDEPLKSAAELKTGVEEQDDLLSAADESNFDPATPSKQINSKRKAYDEDDDEFSLFDVDTPEPKRRRS